MGVQTRVEGKRGCGVRKPGGLYLVSGGLSEPCPLIPFETSVCPTCGEGIRAARGFTWVDGGKLIPPTVHGTVEHSRVCPLGPQLWHDTGNERFKADYSVRLGEDGEMISRIGRCGLLWIGEQFYPTSEAFMAEAAAMGVSRRITAVPREFEVGKTWVLLGHRKAITRACSACGDLPMRERSEEDVLAEVEERGKAGVKFEVALMGAPDPDCPVCEGTGYEHRPGVITAFLPTAVEYVVKGDETDEEIEAMEKRGLTCVEVVNPQEVLEV